MSRRTFVGTALLLTLVVAGVLSGFASPHPDGLESVATASGFAADARDSVAARSPLADYGVAAWGDSRIAGGVAGVAGCVLVFVLVTGVTRGRVEETRS